MAFSFLHQLECPRCHASYDPDTQAHLCTCGSPLLVRYDLEAASKQLSKQELQRREPSLWRYHELLPVRSPENVITLGEGMTPLIPLKRLGAQLEMPNLYVKDEGVIPTGSFKARGAAVGVSRAKELGVKTLAMPTNGNAGGAWATYAARAGIEAVIVMPEGAPTITRNECAINGARLFLVNGLINDAGAIVGRGVKAHGWYEASTLKEPYRIEGKKTMGYELAEQFAWDVPDVILYPTGGGVGIIGIYKALRELQQMGWIGERLPRLVAVQATGCAPIVQAWQEGKPDSQLWPNSRTIAFGINVPKALGDFLVLEAVRNTDGCAIAISDEELLQAQSRLATTEGLFVCPEGAATLAAAEQLRASGWIKADERVVLLNTGTGLKYPDTVQVEVPLLQPQDNLPVT
ncbi:threonine synthase [Ktedonobacter racemifer]|uniref:Threonine synthase n=1 Tax=Ktedonobacter racemifer DSM 44963 TaxID=485913 RepID=D6TZU2_KTERA|nr:threonine synthase [Ktedonobacter racemifer]EFH82082.1 threonine synthase [Ktedonobacter racemifer DSM 44963]